MRLHDHLTAGWDLAPRPKGGGARGVYRPSSWLVGIEKALAGEVEG